MRELSVRREGSPAELVEWLESSRTRGSQNSGAIHYFVTRISLTAFFMKRWLFARVTLTAGFTPLLPMHCMNPKLPTNEDPT